jgi:RND family efflux transporter MFP subunit
MSRSNDDVGTRAAVALCAARPARLSGLAAGALIALIAVTLAACKEPAPPAAQIRPVRTVIVEPRAEGETVSLTGHVRARDQGNLAFRIDGRVIERPVNVGDIVRVGQVVARLDPQNQENMLRSAQAGLTAAEAVLTQARLTFARQRELLRDGWTPRARYDDAEAALKTAEAQVNAMQAQVRIAQDQLSYTVLMADAAGSITATGAEAGEVVRAGQMIVQLAQEGGRDAVFDVPEVLIRTAPRDPVVQIALSDDPTITATGRVREVDPQADPATRTYQVKVGIIDPPEAMRLGSTVTGRIQLVAPRGVTVPASAMTETAGRPAVWVFDPASQTVALRNVDVARYDPASVVISQGLDAGEIVVTAGAQVLRPGQKVRRLGGSS